MTTKFILIKLIDGKILDYERNYLEGLTNDEIGLFLLGMKTLEREMMEDFEQRSPIYKISTDPDDLEDEDD